MEEIKKGHRLHIVNRKKAKWSTRNGKVKAFNLFGYQFALVPYVIYKLEVEKRKIYG